MNRIDRLMGIVALLQSKKHQTAMQLALHFDISERTVFRDLRALNEIGIPVQFEPEKGYSIGQGFFLSPIMLTIEEANALSLAEPLIVRFADLSIQKHYGTALTKIKMALGKMQRERLEQAQAGAAHFIPDHYSHLIPATDYLMPLQMAIAERRIVSLVYENADSEPSVREVEPIGLTFYSLNWHLIAWCHLRKDYRDFRTSRIQNLHVTIRPFQKTDHIALTDYLSDIQQKIFENPEHPLT
jgi:predicted DNA-binding transcriptional regulator YafY